jgi:hypothetical protein
VGLALGSLAGCLRPTTSTFRERRMLVFARPEARTIGTGTVLHHFREYAVGVETRTRTGALSLHAPVEGRSFSSSGWMSLEGRLRRIVRVSRAVAVKPGRAVKSGRVRFCFPGTVLLSVDPSDCALREAVGCPADRS